jgi:FkbM family methyltransferase
LKALWLVEQISNRIKFFPENQDHGGLAAGIGRRIIVNREESLNRVFTAFPENSLKDRIRGVYYNIIQDSVKVRYDDGFVVHYDDFGMRFPNIREVLPDLDTCIKGYLARYRLRKGDIVVDAGAFTGTFTTLASKMVADSGRVIAFEPDSQNCRRLLDNIERNGLGNVTVIQKGLWSSDTKLPFRDLHNAGSSFIFDDPGTDPVVDIPVASLDSELKRLGIERIDFVKMDIEGAELEAVKGATNILKKGDTKLAIASYHILDGKETSFELERILGDLGYKAETSFPQHRTTYASKAQ